MRLIVVKAISNRDYIHDGVRGMEAWQENSVFS